MFIPFAVVVPFSLLTAYILAVLFSSTVHITTLTVIPCSTIGMFNFGVTVIFIFRNLWSLNISCFLAILSWLLLHCLLNSLGIPTLLLKNISYILWIEWQGERERQRDWQERDEMAFFHLLVQFSAGCRDWGWVSPKPSALNSAHMDGRNPHAWTVYQCSPKPISKKLDRSTRNMNQCPYEKPAFQAAT